MAEGNHPSCGDEVTIFTKIRGEIIEEITFYGEGCAISQASASLMTELLTGKTKKEAKKIIGDVCFALSEAEAEVPLDAYGEVAALIGVKKFPMRIKCATLPWHAAKDAISD
jgi:nitrogen fixation NifU-like protein